MSYIYGPPVSPPVASRSGRRHSRMVAYAHQSPADSFYPYAPPVPHPNIPARPAVDAPHVRLRLSFLPEIHADDTSL